MKLTEALENAPDFGDTPALDPATPQRRWLSEVGALLSRLDVQKKVQFKASFGTLVQYWKHAIVQIQGQVLDAIEEIKLELELDGRTEIGNAYAPGDVYRFFADLKAVINSAENEILIVDPYLHALVMRVRRYFLIPAILLRKSPFLHQISGRPVGLGRLLFYLHLLSILPLSKKHLDQ